MEECYYKLEGPVLLLAGPGTGKTTNLAKRIKFLVEEKETAPENITVITFTGLAAKNMRNKISDISNKDLFIPYGKQTKMICTMHSLGLRILKEKTSEICFDKNIELLPPKLQDIITKDAAHILDYDDKDADKTLKCRRLGKCEESKEIKCEICNKYKEILRSCNAIDFDDQIFLANKILRKFPDVLNKFKDYCKNLLIDEYQDINASQFELIGLLAKENLEGLFVVGDDDQSIYSWRGGSPEYIRNFERNFGDSAKVKILNEAYRCPKIIYENAIEVVKRFDRSYKSKGKFNYTQAGEGIMRIFNIASEEKEAIKIRSIIQKVYPKKVLILIPTKYFSEPIIKELQKHQINFNTLLLSPGDGLPLISDIFKWSQNNSENMFFRICLEAYINSPNSSIPSVKVSKPEKLKKRKELKKKLGFLWQKVIDGESNSCFDILSKEKDANELYQEIFEVFNAINLALSNGKLFNNIIDVIEKFGIWQSTFKFAHEVNLWVENFELMNSIDSTNVLITTYHRAKGLDADVVCLVGLEQDIIPKQKEDLAEQSRLMFVSMTRAKEELYLFTSRKRSARRTFRNVYLKDRTRPDIKMSCFIDCIPNWKKILIYLK
jgi:DNA helicase II / ATP-dependent DNA helicase PcrA